MSDTPATPTGGGVPPASLPPAPPVAGAPPLPGPPAPSEGDAIPAPGPPTPTRASQVMEWSRPVIAMFSLAIFVFAFFIAWRDSDHTTFNTLVGAVVTLVSTIAGYYFGSSVGSQKKDDIIHKALVTAQGTGTPPHTE